MLFTLQTNSTQIPSLEAFIIIYVLVRDVKALKGKFGYLSRGRKCYPVYIVDGRQDGRLLGQPYWQNSKWRHPV